MGWIGRSDEGITPTAVMAAEFRHLYVPEGRQKRVLIVDDERLLVTTLSLLVRMQGHEPVKAYTGEEAIERVGSDQIDMVLMDINMPGMGGVEAVAVICSAAPDLPVVAFSGGGDADWQRRVMAAGAVEAEANPLDPARLSVILERYLGDPIGSRRNCWPG